MAILSKPTVDGCRQPPRDDACRPHVVLIVPRGEAVRNFLYSDTLQVLSQSARVTLLSVLHDDAFRSRFAPLCEDIVPLGYHPERPLVGYLRALVETAHDRWLWSEVVRNRWAIYDEEASTSGAKAKRLAVKGLARVFAHGSLLGPLTSFHQRASWALRPTDEFLDLFRRIRPDVVFNCSHIHGPAAEEPLRAARKLGIPTVGFIFSWDNLTSRSRIMAPYDHYLVWHEGMRDQLLGIYHRLSPERVHITGTPQFDFHFNPRFVLSREELCSRTGVDPRRPFILYTTGMDRHFPQEHLHVELVIRLLHEMNPANRPQLVVRTYVKGTSPEMKAIAAKGIPDVVFPPVLWDEAWFTPRYEDLAVYTSLIHQCSLGINAASTVSLELMMLDKPVVNLGFDPPGSNLPYQLRFERHLLFDHYRPVVESGATMVARSPEDMRSMLHRGLSLPGELQPQRRRFVSTVFGSTLDGRAGRRVAERLLDIAESRVGASSRLGGLPRAAAE